MDSSELDSIADRIVERILKRIDKAFSDQSSQKLMNIDDLSRAITLSFPTVWRLKPSGRIPHNQVGAAVRFDVADDDIMNQVGELLDDSIATKGYIIHATEQTSLLDLSQIDFDALKAHFQKGRKRTEAEKLKRAIGAKLNNLVTLNKTRTDLMEKFKKLIDEYNKGLDVEGFFAKLTDFVKELSQEEQRSVTEKLSEEE